MKEPDPVASTARAGKPSTVGMIEYFIGGAAVLVSAISLALAISANATQERLLAASTWPILQYGTGNRSDEGESAISLSLQNAGVGPARVRTVQVFYDGRPHGHARALLEPCCGAKGRPLLTVTSTPEKVLTAGDGIRLLRVDEAGADPALWQALNQERFGIRVLACHCSALDDCRVMDSTLRDPSPIAQCPDIAPALRWRG